MHHPQAGRVCKNVEFWKPCQPRLREPGSKFFLNTGLTIAYVGAMADSDRTPNFTAKGLEAHIEVSLQELEAGKGRPMRTFIAELKADFRAAYPDIVETLQPAPAKQYNHN
jgi:hypothetical protein